MNLYMKNENLHCRLAEIREACATATSTEDTNINLIIEEIDRLATECIVILGKENQPIQGDMRII